MKNQDFSCKITNVASAGLEVDLQDGRQGFVPRKETSWALFAPHPAILWHVDQHITARFYGDIMPNGRLILSIKRIEKDPWVMSRDKYKIDQVVEGPIYAILSDSIYFEIKKGVAGRIPIYELGLDDYDYPQQAVGRGDIIRAKIQAIDDENSYYVCSNKEHLTNLEKSKFPLSLALKPHLQNSDRNFSLECSDFATGALSILLIDDEEEYCISAKTEFEMAGHVLDYSTNPKAGINKAVTGKYDIIIVDKIMPGLDGIDVCKAIQEKTPNANIAIFTGEGSIYADNLQGLDPIPLVLNKPFGIEDVEAACFRESRFPWKEVPIITGQIKNTEENIIDQIQGESLEEFFVIEMEKLTSQVTCQAWGAFEWKANKQQLKTLKVSGFRDQHLIHKMEWELHYSPIMNAAHIGETIIAHSLSESQESFKSWCKNLSRWLDFESLLIFPIFVNRKSRYAVLFSSVWANDFEKDIIQKIASWTEIMSAKIEAKLAYLELEKIQRFALQGELTASLTHELLNRLGIILLNLRTISRAGPRIRHKLQGKKVEVPLEIEILTQASEKAIGAADRIDEIITSFLQTTEDRTRKEIDINKIILPIITRLSPIAQRNRVVLQPMLKDHLIIYGSPVRIGQVIENVMLNAIQQTSVYRKVNGRIIISSNEFVSGEGKIASIIVKDNGPGIHAEHWEKIFEMGFSTKPDGIGIGLALCKAIMRSIGGEICIEKSIIFEGTTMKINIPSGNIRET